MRTRTTRSSGRVLPCSDRALNRCMSDTSSPIGVRACHHSDHRLEWRHRVIHPKPLNRQVFRARRVPHAQVRDFQNLSPDCPPPTCRSVTPNRYFVSPREATAREAAAHPPWIPHEGEEQGEGDRPGGGREREHRGEAERIGQKPRSERRAERHRRHQRGAEARSEEHTSELQSQSNLVCRLLLEKKKNKR